MLSFKNVRQAENYTRYILGLESTSQKRSNITVLNDYGFNEDEYKNEEYMRTFINLSSTFTIENDSIASTVINNCNTQTIMYMIDFFNKNHMDINHPYKCDDNIENMILYEICQKDDKHLLKYFFENGGIVYNYDKLVNKIKKNDNITNKLSIVRMINHRKPQNVCVISINKINK